MPDTDVCEPATTAPAVPRRGKRRRRWLPLLVVVNVAALTHLAWRVAQMRAKPDGHATVLIEAARTGPGNTVELVMKGELQPGEVLNTASWHLFNSGRDAQFARQDFVVGPERDGVRLTWTVPAEFTQQEITDAVARIRAQWTNRPFELNPTNSPAVLMLTNAAGNRFIGLLAFTLTGSEPSPPGGVTVIHQPSLMKRPDGELPVAEVFVETREPALITLDFFVRRRGALAHVPPLSGWTVAGTNGMTDARFTWHAPFGSVPKPAWGLRVFDFRTKMDSLVMRAFASDLQGLTWRPVPKPATVHPVGQGSYELVLFTAQETAEPPAEIEALIIVRRHPVPIELATAHPLGRACGGEYRPRAPGGGGLSPVWQP